MRMHVRRLTRLTNAFSKKFENHKAALALHVAHYNFCKIHCSLLRDSGHGSRGNRSRQDIGGTAQQKEIGLQYTVLPADDNPARPQ